MIIVDIILLLMTIACIVFCSILNKRISQIQVFKNELTNAFAKFDKSITKAEKLLNEVSNFSEQGQITLNKLTEKAQIISDNLENLFIKADHLADDLSTSISAGNNIIKKLNNLNKISEDFKIEILNKKSLEKTSDKKSKHPKIKQEIPNIQENQDDSSLTENIIKTFRTTLSQKDYYNLLQRKRLTSNEI